MSAYLARWWECHALALLLPLWLAPSTAYLADRLCLSMILACSLLFVSAVVEEART